MTIIPVEKLDQNDLDLLGDNVTEAIRIDHDRAAMTRSLACREETDAPRPRVTIHPSILARRPR